jgi:alpha-glucuronidase
VRLWEPSAGAHRGEAESGGPTTTSGGHHRAEAESIGLSTTSVVTGAALPGVRRRPESQPELWTPPGGRAGGSQPEVAEPQPERVG